MQPPFGRKPGAAPDPNDPQQDAFSEFPSEPAAKPEAPVENRDWFAEFPDEKHPSTRPGRAKSWVRLTDSLKDEKE